MSVRDGLERVARTAAARPIPVLLAVALLALGGGLLALRLEPSTGADTLASRSSSAFQATDALHSRFGDDAVIVLIDEHVPNLVLTPDLGRVLRLEGCLGGNVPHGARPYGGAQSACAGLAQLKPGKLVYGPGTFLNESVNAVQAQVQAELAQIQQGVTAAVAAAKAQAARAGLDAAGQQQAADAARAQAQAQATDDAAPARPQLRPPGHPADRQQAVHLADRLRPGARRGRAEGPLRLRSSRTRTRR